MLKFLVNPIHWMILCVVALILDTFFI